MSEETAIAVQQQPGELSPEQVLNQLAKIQELMKKAMVKDVDYGTIPGTPKPTLLKPGAEKLNLMFRLDPQYEIVKDVQEGDHVTIVTRCTLYHIPTSARLGSGMGSCSTRESKYAYRKAGRLCPSCGKDSIIKPKPKPPRPQTWWCAPFKGGCNENFALDDPAIVEPGERADNPDIPDQWNTVLKMSNKRALIAAVLNVTGASQIFTQDVEDFGSKVKQGKPEAERPDDRQSATDRPTKEQWNALQRDCIARFGQNAGQDWLKAELEIRKIKLAKDITVGIVREIREKLLNQGAQPEDSQSAPSDEVNESFDRATGFKLTAEDHDWPLGMDQPVGDKD